MIVVSDTTAITNLMAIRQIELLQLLYREVYIPDAVFAELRVKHPAIPDFIRQRSVADEASARRLISDSIDEGEAEAIILAEELKADYLLIDEIAGRDVARQRGLRVTGLLGVLLRAKEDKFLAEIRPLLDELSHEAGFWFSADLRHQILREAGELSE